MRHLKNLKEFFCKHIIFIMSKNIHFPMCAHFFKLILRHLRQPYGSVGNCLTVFRRDGYATLRFCNHIIRGIYCKYYRFARHHIIHKLVRAHAKPEKRLALKAYIKRVELEEKLRDLITPHRIEKFYNVVKFELMRLFNKALLFRALPIESSFIFLPRSFSPAST